MVLVTTAKPNPTNKKYNSLVVDFSEYSKEYQESYEEMVKRALTATCNLQVVKSSDIFTSSKKYSEKEEKKIYRSHGEGLLYVRTKDYDVETINRSMVFKIPKFDVSYGTAYGTTSDGQVMSATTRTVHTSTDTVNVPYSSTIVSATVDVVLFDVKTWKIVWRAQLVSAAETDESLNNALLKNALPKLYESGLVGNASCYENALRFSKKKNRRRNRW